MRKMSNKRKGQLRMRKLQEAEANGSLAKCRKRIDVAKLVGINDNKVGYTWTQRMIHDKCLYEVEIGRDKSNRALYQYCINNKNIITPEPISDNHERPDESLPTPKYGKRTSGVGRCESSSDNATEITLKSPNGTVVTFTNVGTEIADKVISAIIKIMGGHDSNGKAL